MKKPRRKFQAFTLIELLAVIAVLALYVATLLPALARTKAPAQRIYCANNLKGIGQAFHVWGQEHGDAYPTRVAVANGGYADYVGLRQITAVQATSRGVFGYFMVMSNELSTPKIVVCPSENEGRMQASTFAGIIPAGSANVVPYTNDLNVSYFVGVDAADTTPKMFLTGDHNLGSDGNITPAGGFVTAPVTYKPSYNVSLGTNFVVNGGVGWLNTMHSNQGNVGLADGSVSQYNRVQLQQALALRNSVSSPNISEGPGFINPVGCTGAGVNRIQFP